MSVWLLYRRFSCCSSLFRCSSFVLMIVPLGLMLTYNSATHMFVRKLNTTTMMYIHNSSPDVSVRNQYTTCANRKRPCDETFKKSNFMTIAQQKGRFGNHAFQFLSLMGTAIDKCYTPVLTEKFGSTLSHMFDTDFIKQIPSDDTKKWNKFKPLFYAKYDSAVETLTTTHNWTLSGYFQSWRYFYCHNQYLKTVIKFRPELLRAANDFLADISRPGDILVSIHVRRGDMMGAHAATKGYVVADVGYIRRAMQYYIDKISNSYGTTSHFFNDAHGGRLKFIFLSDGIQWCKDNFENESDSNIFFSPFNSDYEKDLALMSLSNHNIITSGSFGWFGAWLNGGSVVYFKGFPAPGSLIDQLMNREDYYPPEWIGMM